MHAQRGATPHRNRDDLCTFTSTHRCSATKTIASNQQFEVRTRCAIERDRLIKTDDQLITAVDLAGSIGVDVKDGAVKHRCGKRGTGSVIRSNATSATATAGDERVKASDSKNWFGG